MQLLQYHALLSISDTERCQALHHTPTHHQTRLLLEVDLSQRHTLQGAQAQALKIRQPVIPYQSLPKVSVLPRKYLG